jgi:ribosome biogenesis protein BMS1
MGPKGVGKSTIIRSLVKMYTRHTLTDTTGPITVITGKEKRVTFLECPNDTCAMIDVAKVADLVLLVVDAKFGFEMETFEFLNILQTHGFPKIMGVFTHLDQFRTTKSLKNTKKKLKDRFWTEIYNGAKMFYFSGTINAKYLKNEVQQLTLFLSRVKYRPLIWRNWNTDACQSTCPSDWSGGLCDTEHSCHARSMYIGSDAKFYQFG